ncbi:MAG TPA: hypothetical protein VFW68_09030 [Rhodocyclaceae bacterium]|nr:hypothetical protein [Rhodocyclaceae bacterium]
METLALVPDAPSPTPPASSPSPASPDFSGPRFARRPAQLRVALVADGPTQSHWLAEAFRQTALAAWADVVLVLVGKAKPKSNANSSPAHHRLPRAWRVYQQLDRWLFGHGSDPSQGCDLRHLGPSVVSIDPADESAWREELARANVDVLFVLGEEALVERFAATARYGAWHFRFGGSSTTAWAGLAEVATEQPITSSSLVARLPDGSERVLADSWTRTLPFSISGNRSRLLHRTAQYPARALRDLAEQGADWLARRPPAAPQSVAGAASTHPAVFPAAGRIAGQVAGRALARGLQKITHVDQWFLAYRFGSGDDWQHDWGNFTCLMPPKDRFWADPFPIKWGERYLIYFEELPFATNRAHLSVIEVTPDGRCSESRMVLSRDYHLSYPFLFEAEGRLFMIPETGQNRCVELYSCTRIPDQWRLEKVLLRDAYYVDATVHHVGGRWWMFVNVGNDASNLHDELHLYYADHFLGPWHAHAGNPVKSDVRSARSAGKLFEDEGTLYRPAQICAPLYGSGLSVNQIQTLTPELYAEQEVGRILPPWGSRILGVHTLNRAGNLTVVDGFMRRRRWGPDDLSRFEPERLLPGHVSEARS